MIKFKGNIDKKNILKLIDLELYSVHNSLEIQQDYHKQVLIFFKDFAENMDIDENSDIDNVHQYIDSANFNLKKIQFNINTLEQIIEKINILKAEANDITKIDLKTKLDEYNKSYEELMGKVFINTTNIQNFIQEFSFLEAYTKNTNETENTQNIDSKPENIKENTLIISEMQGKVIFPYTFSELQEILDENKDTYSTIEDVIEAKYTKPISYYRFSAISRFKESYKLILEKEHGSKLSAIELALELFSNYNLHPAIITACKNLNQLDIYLSCLEYDELNDFHFFKIIYEIAPVTVKHFSLFNSKNIQCFNNIVEPSENASAKN